MVLAERNSELVRNGRRSRGPSPNGHGTNSGGGGVGGGGGGAGSPDTSSDDDNSIKRNGKSSKKQSEYEEKIRVGRDYQAVCPPLIPEQERKPEVLNDRALLVWSPTKEIPDTKLEEYISVAKEKYGYNGEQALGMLFWHKHDLERAVMDLANFTPFPDEWTVEDKVLFEQAFQFHGKSFHRIRQMLPDKSIASLVKYYYSWKKTRHRQSVIDRQEKAKTSKEGSENGSDNGSNEDSDIDDKDQILVSTSGSQDQTNSKLGGTGNVGVDISGKLYKSSEIVAVEVDTESTASISTNAAAALNKHHHQQTPPLSNTNDSFCAAGGRNTPSNVSGGGSAGCCSNCGVVCNVLNISPHGKLCSSCHHHWRRTGNKRPTSGPYFGKRSRDRDSERHKRKPPKGMYINHDDIVALASAENNQDELLANIDREIVSLLGQVHTHKQLLSSQKRKSSDGIEDILIPESPNRIIARWTNEELKFAVEGVKKFGKDYQAIADVLGNKTEAHVRSFYMNYRRRFNLDQMVKEYELEKETKAAAAGARASAGVSIMKEDTKKKDATIIDESDNTTSSETNVSKSTITEEGNNSITQKDTIMEIDLDAEQPDTPPAAKKIALSTGN